MKQLAKILLFAVLFLACGVGTSEAASQRCQTRRVVLIRHHLYRFQHRKSQQAQKSSDMQHNHLFAHVEVPALPNDDTQNIVPDRTRPLTDSVLPVATPSRFVSFDGRHFAFHQKINFFALKNSFLI